MIITIYNNFITIDFRISEKNVSFTNYFILCIIYAMFYSIQFYILFISE